ncbi:hypothetical protein AVEN_239667-1 [Araneus ventricosus]|uniref:Uncharacterized protein n=1 Tax=Araneus ventricosus TaxID=182803 RepID=A0A4Y2CRF6_ARAVE|nr:hypothetical protein AVEN_239667-1 [Araneus ventricosus]
MRKVLNEKFHRRWIGREGSIPWPSRSPDIKPLDFFLWGYVKNIVYQSPILDTDELKSRITAAIQTVDSAMLHGRGGPSVLQKVPFNGPYAPFGFESIEKQLWRNKQNDRPINDSEIKAVLSQLFKIDQWLPPAGHVSEDVTSHA